MPRHARRRKTSHHRRRHHSRRRVGAIDFKKVGTKVLGIAGGAFVAKTLNNIAVKQFPTMDGKIIALIDIGAGLFVPRLIKSDLGEALGDGMLAVGTLSLAQNLGVLQGMGALAKRVPSRVIGAGSQPFLTKMVGGTSRNYIKQMVGSPSSVGSAYGVMESMNRAAVGAAGRTLGALAIEE